MCKFPIVFSDFRVLLVNSSQDSPDGAIFIRIFTSPQCRDELLERGAASLVDIATAKRREVATNAVKVSDRKPRFSNVAIENHESLWLIHDWLLIVTSL